MGIQGLDNKWRDTYKGVNDTMFCGMVEYDLRPR